jgi:hypothetical protein
MERPVLEMLIELVGVLRLDLAERNRPLTAELGEESKKLITKLVTALDMNTERHKLQAEPVDRLVRALGERLDLETGARSSGAPKPN